MSCQEKQGGIRGPVEPQGQGGDDSGKATDIASASESGQNLLDRVSFVFIA